VPAVGDPALDIGGPGVSRAAGYGPLGGWVTVAEQAVVDHLGDVVGELLVEVQEYSQVVSCLVAELHLAGRGMGPGGERLDDLVDVGDVDVVLDQQDLRQPEPGLG